MRRFFRFLGIVAILVGAGIFLFAHFVAPYWIIQVRRNTEDKAPDYYGMSYEALQLETEDGLTLDGYWVSAEKPKGTVLLVHGIRGFKEYWWWMDLPQTLVARGYNVVAFDNRAHGKSEGEYCTFGYYEQRDVSRIVDQIEAKQPGLPIAIWGHSLGGCIALLALEKDTRIDVGIVESTFTDMHQIVHDYGSRMLRGLLPRFVSDYVAYRAGVIANFDAGSVYPLRSVQAIEQPLFIGHGDADHKVKFEYGKQLYECAQSGCKSFYPVPGARHLKVWESGGIAYQQAILDFLGENLN